MPNWCYNELRFKTEEDCRKVAQLMKSENRAFDFNNVIPMPKYIYGKHSRQRCRKPYPCISLCILQKSIHGSQKNENLTFCPMMTLSL